MDLTKDEVVLLERALHSLVDALERRDLEEALFDVEGLPRSRGEVNKLAKIWFILAQMTGKAQRPLRQARRVVPGDIDLQNDLKVIVVRLGRQLARAFADKIDAFSPPKVMVFGRTKTGGILIEAKVYDSPIEKIGLQVQPPDGRSFRRPYMELSWSTKRSSSVERVEFPRRALDQGAVVRALMPQLTALLARAL